MSEQPRVLRVETGIVPETLVAGHWAGLLDYRVYDGLPRPLRAFEQRLRMDWYLAIQARRVAAQYDVIWAGSEKVAIPLSLMGTPRPMIVVAHHPESVVRSELVRRLGLARRWAGVGYTSFASRDFLNAVYGVPKERLFQAIAVDLARFRPRVSTAGGPILSLGVAKRDYPTLVGALRTLPGYQTDILVSSRYGDKYMGEVGQSLPPRVRLLDRVPNADLPNRYQQSRFVVIPLEQSTQSAAGASVALEAAASGKAVVATRTAGMPSFVIHDETGILVSPGDVTALGSAIQRLHEDPALAARMGAAGRKYVEMAFDPAIVISKVWDILARVRDTNSAE